MNLKIENLENINKQGSSSNLIQSQNEQVENKPVKKVEEKIEIPQNVMNYQKALHKIMSGDNTYNQQSSKLIQMKEQALNFSAVIKNPQQYQTFANVAESPTNSIFGQQHFLQQQVSQNKDKMMSLTHQQSTIQFEYMPRKDVEGFDHQKMTVNQDNQKVVFVNFKMKDFPEASLNHSINALVYGIKATLCIPNRKYSAKVILTMSNTSADKLRVINPDKKSEQIIDITKIYDIEYGIKNPAHGNIRGIDNIKVMSFYVFQREDIEGLIQFEDTKTRDIFFQGFQHFVKQSHKTQLNSGNIFKLRQQIENQILEEKGKTEKQFYDISEIVDIFDSKVQMSISRSYLRQIYVTIIKRDLDEQLTQQKMTYIHYQKILSDETGLLKPLDSSQFLEIIDTILDRSELYQIYEKAAQVTDIKNKNKSLNQLTIEGFKQFILYNQKEIISMGEIEKIFKKILAIEKINQQQIHNEVKQVESQQIEKPPSNQIDDQSANQIEEMIVHNKKNAVSFQGFVRYIYSKYNSIFNPAKESIYQNMNKPINEYYVNSAKNIFNANFDIITMRQIAGFTYQGHEKYFPLLYALSRGARYIEVEVWDGDGEPIIVYGPIMNSKINVNEFLTQLSKQAFVINQFPLFLNLVPHCNVKQQFKLKYLLEKILKDHLYIMPSDYKERTNLPSPNELKFKVILVGKLPHTYDGLIQETYTQQDVIKHQFNQQQNAQPQKDAHNVSIANQINTTLVQDPILEKANANITLLSNLNNSNHLVNNMQNLSLPQQASGVNVQHVLNTNNSMISQQQIAGQLSQNNRSINQVDGALLTPVHVFSYHNIPGDSIDQEMNELIMKEEMEENQNIPPVGFLNKPKDTKDTKDTVDLNILNGVFPSSRGSGLGVEQQSTLRRGTSSTVKAIDSFFSKNADAPKFKKFLQNKYEDPVLIDHINGMGQINEEEYSENLNKNYVYDTVMEHSNEMVLNGKLFQSNQNAAARKASLQVTASNRVYQQGSLQQLTNREEEVSLRPTDSSNPLPAPRKQQDTLYQINQLQVPTFTNGINGGTNTYINSAIFQLHCIRDYAPILASNTMESLYSMYISKIQRKKPALWEVYEFSQREINQHVENKLGYSVLSSYATISSFTKYYLAMTKTNCKSSDSINVNPIPHFMNGIQFVLSFLHTFDKNSLIYQSRFYENGGQQCGYILKPFSLRNHIPTAANKHRKSLNTDNVLNFGAQQFANGKIDEMDELDYDNGEDTHDLKLMQANKTKRYYVQMEIVSGYNLSTFQSDRVDAYVEVIVYDGDNIINFKTSYVENNNVNPKWNHDIKFTVTNPSQCFIIFQVVNYHYSSLLGWYSIPFECIRQGLRVVPLRDGFFNTIKNSFVLCEISIVRDSQGT